MKIKRRSPVSGKIRTKELDITPQQLQSWQEGALIQVAMPSLNQEEREFVITGIVEDEWDDLFGTEEY